MTYDLQMFIGHFAVALASKRIAPKTSLGTLMLATGFVDVLWPFFVLFGWEHVRIDPGMNSTESQALLSLTNFALKIGNQAPVSSLPNVPCQQP